MLSGPTAPTRVPILLPGYPLLNGYPDAQVPVDRPKYRANMCSKWIILALRKAVSLVILKLPKVLWHMCFLNVCSLIIIAVIIITSIIIISELGITAQVYVQGGPKNWQTIFVCLNFTKY